MKTALEEAGEDVNHYYDLWKAALAREARLRAALAEAEARAQLAPVADDYPAAVFRELWRVLATLRAARGEEGRA